MKINYENERGSLTFGGGSRSDFNLTKIEGLGIVDKVVTTATYYNQPGRQTLNAIDGPRTITISGDLKLTAREQYADMMSILSLSGVLTVEQADGTRRLIDIANTSVTPGERYGKWRTYVIQFYADSPYFRGTNETVFNAYGLTNYINSTFRFPGVFSTTFNDSFLNYAGNAIAEPTQIVITASATPDILESADIGVLIKNETTGEAIKLNYQIQACEQITIDIKKREIYNQYGDDLMQHVDSETFLDGFHLKPGNNLIHITNYQTNIDMAVNITYTDMFCEAVF